MIANLKNISVVIPVYNREKFIGNAIQSVLEQTMKPAEIIVVDDGSEDFTSTVVMEKMRENCSIRYIYQKNMGPSAARNTGIKAAEGEYIAFLDSDDEWNRKKLEIQGNKLAANPGSLISHTGERWLRRGEHLNQKKKHAPGDGDIFHRCLSMCVVGMSTVMAHRSLFDKYGYFDEKLRCCEDYDLWLRVSLKEVFLLVDQPLTTKNGGRQDQVSFKYRVGMDRFRIYALEKLIKAGNITCHGDKKEAITKEFIKKCTLYGNGCLKHGKTEEGRRYLEKAEAAKKCGIRTAQG